MEISQGIIKEFYLKKKKKVGKRVDSLFFFIVSFC